MRKALSAGAAFGVLLAFLAGAPAQAAGVETSIRFEDESVGAEYGAEWHLRLNVQRVAGSDYWGAGAAPVVLPSDGTVDVYLAGAADPWIEGLPVLEGGDVYVSQPTGAPLLEAGTHELRAQFSAAAGSGLLDATTSAAATVDVTSSEVVANLVMLGSPDDDSLALEVEVGLAGEWMERSGSIPAGAWSMQLREKGDEEIVTERLIDATDLDASASSIVRFDRLRDGATYEALAEFRPAAAIAGGLTVRQPAPVAAEIDGSPAALLGAPLSVSPTIVAASAGALLLLTAIVVALLVVGARAERSAPARSEIESPEEPARAPQERPTQD